MKFIFILLFSFILTSQSKQGLTNSIFGEISKSSMINPAHPSDELVDLLYLKIISESFNKNTSINYKFEHKVYLTETNNADMDSFNIKWNEIIDGVNYEQSIGWQTNFHTQVLYLLNNDWVIQNIIDHKENNNKNQKIYIFKKIIKQ
jgi:hypothetical protein|tara:strand:- start:200 stop:640 length:441 start_codon:yes stop_codon:yes gene_type:complete